MPSTFNPPRQTATAETMPSRNYTEPTTGYWQTLHESLPAEELQPPYRHAFPVRLQDGRWLKLPIRQRSGQPELAVASFIANHASFGVLDALAGHMITTLGRTDPDVVVGLPTLGLALAAPIARALGHERFVPFGTSRKFWYDEALSDLSSSITTETTRRLYVDPNLVPLLQGRRVLLVDDTISSGKTVISALSVLRKVGANVVGLSFGMSQGSAWRELLARLAPDWAERVSFEFQTPHLMFSKDLEGWIPQRAARDAPA
jgi:adenine/guanine phosphoribosyltransferase-like PRPP-binding protein